MLQDVLNKAHELYLNKATIKRERGFHASSAGYCTKKVILKAVFDIQEELKYSTKRIFEIGHMFHDLEDEVLRLYIQETSGYLWIQPTRLFSMKNIMESAFLDETGDESIKSPVKLGVFGTPDGIIIDMVNKGVIIPDFKTANERSFNYKKKGSRSIVNEAQLGTYLPSIMSMLNHVGITWPVTEASIIYINKSDGDYCTHQFDPQGAIDLATSYWDRCTRELAVFVKNNSMLPVGDPPEKWMCNYCDLFKTKTECNSINDTTQLSELKGVQL